MKCDELKAEPMIINDDYTALYYAKDSVDAAIAELKTKLEDVQASAYAESVDAGMENRKLKRALWMARASSAKNKVRFFGWSFDEYNTTLLINIDGHKYKMPKQSRMMTCLDWMEIFERVEERCRQKAEEYK